MVYKNPAKRTGVYLFFAYFVFFSFFTQNDAVAVVQYHTDLNNDAHVDSWDLKLSLWRWGRLVDFGLGVDPDNKMTLIDFAHIVSNVSGVLPSPSSQTSQKPIPSPVAPVMTLELIDTISDTKVKDFSPSEELNLAAYPKVTVNAAFNDPTYVSSVDFDLLLPDGTHVVETDTQYPFAFKEEVVNGDVVNYKAINELVVSTEPFVVTVKAHINITPPIVLEQMVQISTFEKPVGLRLDGIDDYVQISDAKAPKPTSAITVETWFRWIDENASNYGKVISKPFTGTTSPYTSFSIGQGENGQQLRAEINVNGLPYFTPLTNIGNGWHHLAMTWSSVSQTMNFYIDGTLRETRLTPTGIINYYATPLRFGANGNNQLYNEINGDIDEVRIWNYARSSAQIQASMNAENSPSTSGLVGYWKLNEELGGRVYDSVSGEFGKLGSENAIDEMDPQWIEGKILP